MESPRTIHGSGSWLQHLVKGMETSMDDSLDEYRVQITKLHFRRTDSLSFLIAG
jgi:hypothetical protein